MVGDALGVPVNVGEGPAVREGVGIDVPEEVGVDCVAVVGLTDWVSTSKYPALTGWTKPRIKINIINIMIEKYFSFIRFYFTKITCSDAKSV